MGLSIIILLLLIVASFFLSSLNIQTATASYNLLNFTSKLAVVGIKSISDPS
jgi:hypothetical protein